MRNGSSMYWLVELQGSSLFLAPCRVLPPGQAPQGTALLAELPTSAGLLTAHGSMSLGTQINADLDNLIRRRSFRGREGSSPPRASRGRSNKSKIFGAAESSLSAPEPARGRSQESMLLGCGGQP